MKLLVATILLAGATSASAAADAQFMEYVAKFGKSYGSFSEYELRSGIFKHSLQLIERLNAEPDSSHRAGLNRFSDYTHEEYSAMLGLYNVPEPDLSRARRYRKPLLKETPASVDWRDAGVVTAVKDQGMCGSCYAFATIGPLESGWAIKTGELYSLSEQQIVDCTCGLEYMNQGCFGGWYYNSWDYSRSNAIQTESSYPYISDTGDWNTDCLADGQSGLVQNTGYVKVDSATEDIKAALAEQPVASAVAADSPVFQTYESGVITSASCGTNVDHAIWIVGYGASTGSDNEGFYIVKNSWGESWGEAGYVRIGATSGKGFCGINQNVAFPSFD